MRRKHDIMGTGGNIYIGERTIRKGGFIHFDSCIYQDDALIPLVGNRVMVHFEGESPFATGPIDIKDRYGRICTIDTPIKDNQPITPDI